MIGFSLLLVDAQAKWYLKVAESGYLCTMYNTLLVIHLDKVCHIVVEVVEH